MCIRSIVSIVFYGENTHILTSFLEFYNIVLKQ